MQSKTCPNDGLTVVFSNIFSFYVEHSLVISALVKAISIYILVDRKVKIHSKI